MQRQNLSLNAELLALMNALDGVRLMCDLLRDGDVPTSEDEKLIPRAVSAMLAVLVQRLRDLSAVVRGELDAGMLVAQHNSTDEAAPDGDIVIPRSRGAARGRGRPGTGTKAEDASADYGCTGHRASERALVVAAAEASGHAWHATTAWPRPS